MGDQDSADLGVMRYRTVVRKWEGGRTPEDGPPDAIEERVWFEDADGTEITDPDRIRELEAAYRRQQEEG